MSTEHTPGPWHVARNGDVYGPRGSDDLIAAVRFQGHGKPNNAHIIAAAPDMLAALRVALDALDAGDGRPACAIRAAIAKAEG